MLLKKQWAFCKPVIKKPYLLSKRETSICDSKISHRRHIALPQGKHRSPLSRARVKILHHARKQVITEFLFVFVADKQFFVFRVT